MWLFITLNFTIYFPVFLFCGREPKTPPQLKTPRGHYNFFWCLEYVYVDDIFLVFFMTEYIVVDPGSRDVLNSKTQKDEGFLFSLLLHHCGA